MAPAPNGEIADITRGSAESTFRHWPGPKGPKKSPGVLERAVRTLHADLDAAWSHPLRGAPFGATYPSR
jgi:hypothetical protein